MMDNLSVHGTAAVIDEVKKAGHDLLFRPPYSPDFFPVELAFGKIKMYLKSHKYEINQHNLVSYICAAIHTITLEDCESWFKACSY
jgi:transposase